MTAIGGADYRDGAGERLNESLHLLRRGLFSGSIYLAGRAVEGTLRAMLWEFDSDYASGRKTLETGHDLRQLLKMVRNLGAFRGHASHDAISADVQRVGRLWWNNMRFLPASNVRKIWYDLGEFGGRRTMKRAVEEYFDACSAIFKRCEAIWQSRGQ